MKCQSHLVAKFIVSSSSRCVHAFGFSNISMMFVDLLKQLAASSFLWKGKDTEKPEIMKSEGLTHVFSLGPVGTVHPRIVADVARHTCRPQYAFAMSMVSTPRQYWRILNVQSASILSSEKWAPVFKLPDHYLNPILLGQRSGQVSSTRLKGFSAERKDIWFNSSFSLFPC